MANTIQIKRKSVAGSQPPSQSLSDGELAINTADGILYAKNSSGVIVNLPLQSISGKTISPSAVQTSGLGIPSAPAYSFASDQNTGIYSPSADSLAVSTGGAQRLRVDPFGRVAIGSSTSWTSRLLVDSGAMPGASQNEVFQVLDSSTTGNFVNIGRFNVNRSSARGSVSLSNSGGGAWERNTMQMFVHGSTYPLGYYRGSGKSDAGWAIIATQGSEINGLCICTYDPDPITFATNHEERMYIASDGKVGVGESTPSASLHIKGSGSTSLSTAFLVKNSSNSTVMYARDDGAVWAAGLYVGETGSDGSVQVLDQNENIVFDVSASSYSVTSHVPFYMSLSQDPGDPTAPGQIVMEYTNDTTITIKMMDSYNEIVTATINLS